MIRNSLFISATLLCLAVFGLMSRLQFHCAVQEGSLPPLWP